MGATMLVLSRKVGEQIVINNDIVVTVIEIRGDKVRLGIEAPPEVPAHRAEVHEILKRPPAPQATDAPRQGEDPR